MLSRTPIITFNCVIHWIRVVDLIAERSDCVCVCFGWLNAPAIYIGAFTVHPFTVTSSFCTRNFLLDRTDDDDDDVQSELPIVLWSSVSFKCALLLSFARSLARHKHFAKTHYRTLIGRKSWENRSFIGVAIERERVCVFVCAHFFTFIKICLLIKTVVHFKYNDCREKIRTNWRRMGRKKGEQAHNSTHQPKRRNTAAIIQLLQSSQVCWTCKSWLDWCTCFHFPTDKMRSRQCTVFLSFFLCMAAYRRDYIIINSIRFFTTLKTKKSRRKKNSQPTWSHGTHMLQIDKLHRIVPANIKSDWIIIEKANATANKIDG